MTGFGLIFLTTGGGAQWLTLSRTLRQKVGVTAGTSSARTVGGRRRCSSMCPRWNGAGASQQEMTFLP